jgi:hypothetical protein
MAHTAHDFSEQVASSPREVPQKVKLLGILLVLVGFIATGIGLGTATERTLASFVINFCYWAGIAQGGFMLAAILVVTTGRWGRPLKRVCESFVSYMPWLYGLLIIFMLGGGLEIYPWMHEEMPAHKAQYLKPGFFVARQVVGLGLLIILSKLFVRTSLRADVGLAVHKYGVENPPKHWSKLIDGWTDNDKEVEASTRKQAILAPIIIITYAFVFSWVAIDLEMTLAPHWYANMFPAWYFTSCFWSGLVFIGIVAHLSRNWLGISHLLDGKVFHDLGKLTLAFCMFWGYTTFAQYLAIWYGNMTEEIGFILLRVELQPWAPVSKLVVMLCFLVPFAMLLSRSLKKIPPAYLTVTGIIAVGIWFERYLVVMPSVYKGDTLPFGVPEIGMTLGFLGGFILVVSSFLAKYPPVTLADPFMEPDPDHIHVVPDSQLHAH